MRETIIKLPNNDFTTNSTQLRNLWWAKLRQAKAEYEESTKDAFVQPPSHEKHGRDTNGFYYWMQLRYGIRMQFDNSGNILGTFETTDKKKFMLFQIKYGY
jgi:hypothetical protein